MEHQCPDEEELEGLYAAAIVGELRRLVTEISIRVTEGSHLATIGSLQVVAARAEDLSSVSRRALHSELRTAGNEDTYPFEDT